MVESYNPYDFVNPVTDPNEFAGRHSELEDIDYYLDLTKSKKPTYINLALIGKRATGKTSLMNMIKHHARERGLLPIKITLNNETAQDDILFFKEVIDNIMTEGAKRGMYGGLKNRIYRKFRSMMDTLEIHADVPLLFGSVYVGKKTKARDAVVPQHILVTDLKELSEEAMRSNMPTIVLLLDECDLLAQNEALLQKIRNIFMETDGYMLILSGTDNMFPAISEVFSPIPRFFKRINVENFMNVQDVVECVLKPLDDEEKNKVDTASIQELFRLSGGMPYEVKLISHYMYRRWKASRSDLMSINVSVLDDVLVELERSRKGQHTAFIARMRECDDEILRILSASQEFPSASDQHLINYMLLGYLPTSSEEELAGRSEEIEEGIDHLIDRDLLTRGSNGELVFSGDDFDRLYLKYYSMSRIHDFLFYGFGRPILCIQQKFIDVLFKDLKEFEINARFDRQTERSTMLAIIGGKYSFPPGESTISLGRPMDWERKFYEDSEQSFRFRLNADFINDGFIARMEFKEVREKAKAMEVLKSIEDKLESVELSLIFEEEISLRNKGIAMINEGKYEEGFKFFDESVSMNPNFEVGWGDKGIALMQLKRFDEAIDCFDKVLGMRPKHTLIWVRRGDALRGIGKVGEAFKSYDKALELDENNFDALNNKANALLDLGKTKEAIELYDKAISLKPGDAIPWTNKANTLAKLGRLEESLQCCDKAIGLNPEYELSYINKGVALLQKGDRSGALVCMQDAIEINDNNHMFWNIKSQALEDMSDSDGAIASAEKSLEIMPTQGNIWLFKAVLEAKAGQRDEAIKSLGKAVNIDEEAIEHILSSDEFKDLRDDPRVIKMTHRQKED